MKLLIMTLLAFGLAHVPGEAAAYSKSRTHVKAKHSAKAYPRAYRTACLVLRSAADIA